MDVKVFIDALEQKAADSIKAEQGDYVVDGLLHCHKCNTPKQCRVVLFGEERTVPCLCKCAVEESERKRLELEREKLERDYAHYKQYEAKEAYDLLMWLDRHAYKRSEKLIAERKQLLRKLCFSEEKMLSWNFENDDRANARISDAMRNYADKFADFREKGQGLILFGDVGTGKSYLAACVAHSLIDKGIPAFMTNFEWIRNKVQETFDGRQDFLDSLNRYQLLVIDDIGTEAETEFMQEIVFSVIDARARAGLPMICTTNLTSDELKNPVGVKKRRIYSRLLGMCLPVEVKGNDRRRKQLASNGQDIKDLLGL